MSRRRTESGFRPSRAGASSCATRTSRVPARTWIARRLPLALLAISWFALGGTLPVWAQTPPGHEHDRGPAEPFLSETTRNELRSLVMQDYQGRMKPLDTFAREMVVKITKKPSFEGWDPIDLYLDWLAHPQHWFQHAVLSVRNEGVKHLLGVDEGTGHVSAASLFAGGGDRYRLGEEVERVHRTPDRDRSRTDRKLLSFDERVNLLLLSLRGNTFRVLPVPGDEKDRWRGADTFETLPAAQRDEFRGPFTRLMEGLRARDDAEVRTAVAGIRDLQAEYGGDVLPSTPKIEAELMLNNIQPFQRVMLPYGLALVLLGTAYVYGLAKRANPRYPLVHPLYGAGMLAFLAAVVFHAGGYALRWMASSHAPLSNGYESLIFISLIIGVAGFWYEARDRRGSTAGLASLLVLVVLGVALLPTFDPAISPIVPVLASYWLIIHVSVITASYSLLGLAACMGMTILILHLFKRPGRVQLLTAVFEMNTLLARVLVAGLAFLTVGTLLGGVWANESWGRYWGWDPKETWALVSILVYGAVVHLRYIPGLNTPWSIATASFLAISSIIMTYLGVNYLLSGLHSYGSGEAQGLPTWAYVTGLCMLLLVGASYWREKTQSWNVAPRKRV